MARSGEETDAVLVKTASIGARNKVEGWMVVTFRLTIWGVGGASSLVDSGQKSVSYKVQDKKKKKKFWL